MSQSKPASSNRREFLQNTGRLAAATALASMVVPKVHAGEDNTIRFVLIGCGGRGRGAASNALSVSNGPTQLVAMADVFPEKLNEGYELLKRGFSEKVDVPDDRKFIGFDGYQQAMDCLRPGDIAHLRHAAGLPLGALHLRDREGAERLHGKAGHGRRARVEADVRPGRSVAQEEPQGRRGPDVPPLQGTRGTVRPHQDGRDRRHHHVAGLPHARPRGSAPLRRASPRATTS